MVDSEQHNDHQHREGRNWAKHLLSVGNPRRRCWQCTTVGQPQALQPRSYQLGRRPAVRSLRQSLQSKKNFRMLTRERPLRGQEWRAEVLTLQVRDELSIRLSTASPSHGHPNKQEKEENGRPCPLLRVAGLPPRDPLQRFLACSHHHRVCPSVASAPGSGTRKL